MHQNYWWIFIFFYKNDPIDDRAAGQVGALNANKLPHLKKYSMMNHDTQAEAPQLSELDLQLLRRSFALSEESKQKGRHPFAALVADEHGQLVIAAGNNSMPPEGDPTQHAELVAAAGAARLMTPEQLAKCTLYTSAEPCCMCAGAIYWTNIGRVVYALSEHALLVLTGDHPENPTLSLPCREVSVRGQRRIEVVGPVLEEKAARPHVGFWK